MSLPHPYRSSQAPQAPLAPPPRHLPLSLLTQLWFGGLIAVWGWIFVIVGSLFCWRIAPRVDSIWGWLVTWIMPLLGLLTALFGSRQGRRAIRLLSDGEVGRGKLLEKRPTNVSFNEAPIYLLRFEFEDRDGNKHELSVRTHRTESLEDEATEQLVYLRDDPRQATLVDHLPGAPRVRPDGTIGTDQVVLGMMHALLPIAAIAVNVAGALLTFG